MTLHDNNPSPPSAARLAAEAAFLPRPVPPVDNATLPAGVTVTFKRRRLPCDPAPDLEAVTPPPDIPPSDSIESAPDSLEAASPERASRVFLVQDALAEAHTPLPEQNTALPDQASPQPHSELLPPSPEVQPAQPIRLKRRRQKPNTRPILIQHVVLQPGLPAPETQSPPAIEHQAEVRPARRRLPAPVEPTIAGCLQQLAALSQEVDAITAMKRWSLEDKVASECYERIFKQLQALSASLRSRKKPKADRA